MEAKDVLAKIRTDLGGLLAAGQELVHVPSLLQYLVNVEREAPGISKAAELQHQSVLTERKAEHDANLEMFRSVLETGQTAVTTCILVCGGASVALLAFVGALYSKNPSPTIPGATVWALVLFASGVLSGAVASGARHVSQFCYAQKWTRSAITFHILAVALVVVCLIRQRCSSRLSQLHPNTYALTWRSTGRPGTRLLSREYRRRAPVN